MNASADSLIPALQGQDHRPRDLAALLGAHTTSQQEFFDLARELSPQDSTPGVWDTLFLRRDPGQEERRRQPPPKRVEPFPSDLVLSTHPRHQRHVAPLCQQERPGPLEPCESPPLLPSPSGPHLADTSSAPRAYARSYIRLSLLGVQNINELCDCSKVLPAAITKFVDPSQKNINKWVATTSNKGKYAQAGKEILQGGAVCEL